MAEGGMEASGEAYADGTMFVDILGDETKVRILEVLISEADRDLNTDAICKQAGIGTSSFYNHIEDLLGWELVSKSRMVGNSPMYEINRESKAAEKLAEFDWALVEYIAEKEEAGELDENNRPVSA